MDEKQVNALVNGLADILNSCSPANDIERLAFEGGRLALISARPELAEHFRMPFIRDTESDQEAPAHP